MSNCKCSMAIRVVGDGCRYCQPQTYIDAMIDVAQDNEGAMISVIKQLCKALQCFNYDGMAKDTPELSAVLEHALAAAQLYLGDTND